ncbi:MAG TPA: hypothetical protein PK264_09200, partial [Hyphomicrobiaceae bacterium]|nr:hypothetical protein [Hyphomicrobiaceae bacterium]
MPKHVRACGNQSDRTAEATASKAAAGKASLLRLALSYAKACIAAFLVLLVLHSGLVLSGQPVNVSPARWLVAVCFAWAFGIPLLPVVMT